MEDPNKYRSDNESDFQNSNKFNQIEEENQTFGIKRKNAQEYEKKIQELLEKNDILETRLKVMGEQKYKLVSKLKNSEEENDILKDQIIKQNNNNKQLNSDNEKYQKEIIELKTSNKELNEKAKDKIESINKELEDKQKQLDNLTEWSIETIKLDGTGSKQKTYSSPKYLHYVMIPNEEDIRMSHDRIVKLLNS